MHFIYKITNLINNKIYIGQTKDADRRWREHKNGAKKSNPSMIIHRAMNKHGIHNFTFEVILCCLDQDAANKSEEKFIKEEDSLIGNNKGYNISLGGACAPRTKEFIDKIKAWHAALSPEQKARRSQIHREYLINFINTKGHPGRVKRTEEQKKKMSLVQLSKNNKTIYTEEVRKRMSDAHVGKKLPLEQVEKMKIAIQASWDKRNKERFDSGEIKCNADGCEVKNKAKYTIINGIRYCKIHGLRMKRNNTTNLKNKKDIHYPNKIILNEDQINIIKNDTRSNNVLSKELGVSAEFIRRMRKKLNPGFVYKTTEAYNRIIFSECQLKDIADDTISTKSLAKKYGVSFGVIKRLRRKIRQNIL